MKAAVYTSYGPPEVVSIQNLPTPKPTSTQLLVKVVASTVNRTDSGFRSAEYFVSRFWSGLFKPKFPVLGSEFAGTVVEIGDEVSEFKIGDQVFGFDDKHFGGHAEFLTIDQNAAVETIPSGISFFEAAAATEGSHYALVDIRAANVKAGQHVLVYGATGAIGSAAVQILKAMNVKVTAVSNSKNVDLVKGLGAEEVIDYQTQDFTQTSNRYDFIFDAVGKSSFGVCKPILKEGGIYISTELGKGGQNVWLGILSNFTKGKRVLFPIPSINKEDIRYLRKLLEAGEFKPVIDRSYELAEIVEAYKYVESGQKTGNVILRVS